MLSHSRLPWVTSDVHIHSMQPWSTWLKGLVHCLLQYIEPRITTVFLQQWISSPTSVGYAYLTIDNNHESGRITSSDFCRKFELKPLIQKHRRSLRLNLLSSISYAFIFEPCYNDNLGQRSSPPCALFHDGNDLLYPDFTTTFFCVLGYRCFDFSEISNRGSVCTQIGLLLLPRARTIMPFSCSG